jgi:hypothetical protein
MFFYAFHSHFYQAIKHAIANDFRTTVLNGHAETLSGSFGLRTSGANPRDAMGDGSAGRDTTALCEARVISIPLTRHRIRRL